LIEWRGDKAMNNKKVLVIDFDADFLQSVSQFLRNEGFQVLNAMDGMAGLVKFKAEEPDLVILEAMLPKLHGFELCSKITKEERPVPVIIMTGVYKDPVYKTEALRTFGATAYFEKPFSLDSLRTTIRRIFNTTEMGSKKEEKKREDEEPSPVEAVSSKQAEKPPVMDRHPLEKKKDVANKIDDDVDRILEDALADFGLGSEKKKAAIKTADPSHKEKTAPAQPVRPAMSVAELARLSIKESPVREMPVKEVPHKEIHVKEAPAKEPVVRESVLNEPIIREPVVKEPGIGEPMFEEPDVLKPAAHEPHVTEWKPTESRDDAKFHKIEPPKKTAAKSLWDPFVEFYPDKKRAFSPRMIGIAAGVLIISSLAFYFLRPHKNPGQADPAEKPQATDSILDNQEAQSTLTSQQLLNTIEKMGQSQDEANAAPKNKQTAPPPDAPIVDNVRPEDIKPIPPVQKPQHQIQIPVPNQAGEAKTEAQDKAANPEAKPKEQAAAANAENAKASLGDLVPLDKVDSQPLIIRRIEPAYPPYAQTLKVEGQVTVNTLISEYGDVLQVNTTRGIEGNFGFERAAENAIKQWKFKPAQKDGVNVRVWKPFTIGFKLKK
jgi:TonB family protein